MKLNISYTILTILIYFFFFLIIEVNSQDDKLKEIEDKFSEVNLIYQNITEIIKGIKYNYILKYRYSSLTRKKEKIEEYISNLKSNSGSNKEASMYELNELIISYQKSCNKFISLNEYFENIKNTIIKIIQIFFLTVIIIIVLILIISGLVYYYFIRKRKSYDILKEEITNHPYYQNSNDSEIVKIKPNKIKKKKKTKKNKKKKKPVEDENDNGNDGENNDEINNDINEKKNENEKEKNENIEVLDE